MEAKTRGQKQRLLRILGRLAGGIVIVEGKHDLKVLKELGVSRVLTLDRLRRNGLEIGREKKAYILTDRDESGEEKRMQISSILLETQPQMSIDANTATSFFRILGIRCVEEAMAPSERILGAEV